MLENLPRCYCIPAGIFGRLIDMSDTKPTQKPDSPLLTALLEVAGRNRASRYGMAMRTGIGFKLYPFLRGTRANVRMLELLYRDQQIGLYHVPTGKVLWNPTADGKLPTPDEPVTCGADRVPEPE